MYSPIKRSYLILAFQHLLPRSLLPPPPPPDPTFQFKTHRIYRKQALYNEIPEPLIRLISLPRKSKHLSFV